MGFPSRYTVVLNSFSDFYVFSVNTCFICAKPVYYFMNVIVTFSLCIVNGLYSVRVIVVLVLNTVVKFYWFTHCLVVTQQGT